jgi:hypothetical protein
MELLSMQFSSPTCNFVPLRSRYPSEYLALLSDDETNNLRSSLIVSDRVTQPHKTNGRIIVLHALSFGLFGRLTAFELNNKNFKHLVNSNFYCESHF